jgi:hypothetical protein
MTVLDNVTTTLDALGVTGWEAAVALRLAQAVDDSGTASAAQLLGSLMGRLASESAPAQDGVERIIAKHKASLPANFGGAAGARRDPKAPRAVPETLPETRAGGVLGALCVECGEPMPPQTSGRPRVRHPHCPRSRGRRSAATAHST